MSNHSIRRLTTWISTALLMAACSGQPVVDVDGLSGSVKPRGGSSSKTTSDPKGAGGSSQVQITTGLAGFGANAGDCKDSCEPGECGPISDNCGSFIECGGCTAPEVCGGSGIPSRCGSANPVCIPKTCAALGKTCGLQSDGCGGIVDCWSETAKASGMTPACQVPGELCIDGACTSVIPVCTKLTCNDYAGNPNLCGPVSDGCSGVLDCGFTCEAGKTCIDSKCTSLCTPLTCAAALASKPSGWCDIVEDGCGGVIKDCATTCIGEDVCGGGVTAGICGHGNTTVCVPKTVADCGTTCGAMGDGCTGVVQCPSNCPVGETCGGDPAKPGQCGVPPTTSCTPTTCSAEGKSCGQISDGCSGQLNCGNCTNGKICGTNNQCINLQCVPLDTSVACRDSQSRQLCGPQSDGCSSTVDCGGCAVGETCGGGGQSLCGVGSSTCKPKTQAEICAYANSCGLQGDGCGGSVNCGSCTWPARCSGTPSVCAIPNVVGCTNLCPYIDKSCANSTQLTGKVYAPNGSQALYNALVYVPNEPLPDITAGRTCERCEDENLGSPIAAALTGPDGSFTLKNVPAGVKFPLVVKMGKWRRVVTIGPINNCASVTLTADQTRLPKNMGDGDPNDATTTKYVNIPRFAVVTGAVDAMECVIRKIGVSDSEFTLPSGGGRIQMYRAPMRWYTDGSCNSANDCLAGETCSNDKCIKSCTTSSNCGTGQTCSNKICVKSCSTNADCPTGKACNKGTCATITPRNSGGGVMNCTNFASGSTTRCASAKDADVVKSDLSSLFAANKLDQYDIAVFDCEGGQNDEDDAYDAALRNWANVGGRVFASHYSYTYLDDDAEFSLSASWNGRSYSDNGTSQTTGLIDKSFPKGNALNTWLGNVGAWSPTYGDGYISISDPRDYVASINPGSERFIYTDSAVRVNGKQISDRTAIQQYAFNTPWGKPPDQLCGRVLYSAFHVAGASQLYDKKFPSYCSTGALTAQEKVLMFMLFDLSACVSVGEPPTPPICTKNTCSGLGATCGAIADGCGGLLDCGTCTAPDTCGGGGVANQCGSNCTRTNCGAQGANCGVIADGCGGTLDCGTCTEPATCGGGGTANVCGTPICTPRSCSDVGAQCGYISNGCGSTINCGTCELPAVCGGSGVPNQCGTGTCTATACGTVKCGFIGDGCGSSLNCGTCDTGQTCINGSCVGTACVPRTCEKAAATCGFIGNGCGGILDCGVCVAPEVCGGAGTPSQCGGSCIPRTCSEMHATCGAISDGCGSILQCGACKSGEFCGGGGVPNQCGTGACTPQTCAAALAECGSVGDGCGGVLDCGVCVAPESCGGAGVPNQCGVGGCVPLTCLQQGANCGPVADGCGGLLDCGTCPNGKTCGGGGVASQCGGDILK